MEWSIGSPSVPMNAMVGLRGTINSLVAYYMAVGLGYRMRVSYEMKVIVSLVATLVCFLISRNETAGGGRRVRMNTGFRIL